MSTSIDLMTPSLYSIGVTSDVNPASAEILNVAFSTFIFWITWMKKNGIDIGVDYDNLPTDMGDELGNDADTDFPLSRGFAVWVAPIFQVAVPAATQTVADAAMASLYAEAMRPQFPEYPDTLPIGSGNMRAPKSRVFFDESDFVKDYNASSTDVVEEETT